MRTADNIKNQNLSISNKKYTFLHPKYGLPLVASIVLHPKMEIPRGWLSVSASNRARARLIPKNKDYARICARQNTFSTPGMRLDQTVRRPVSDQIQEYASSRGNMNSSLIPGRKFYELNRFPYGIRQWSNSCPPQENEKRWRTSLSFQITSAYELQRTKQRYLKWDTFGTNTSPVNS